MDPPFICHCHEFIKDGSANVIGTLRFFFQNQWSLVLIFIRKIVVVLLYELFLIIQTVHLLVLYIGRFSAVANPVLFGCFLELTFSRHDTSGKR
ncbi:MAG: hypothetical protein QF793_02430 [Candidatus Peribacteraceae bacterium]|nr:hypothetical protein [Candidatus Peribacteraceae bacterium]